MTRSLRDALHHAADDSTVGFRLTPDETLELARRRTRHNRWARPLLAAGVVAGIAGGALTLPRVFYPAPTAAPSASSHRTTTPRATVTSIPAPVGPSTYEQVALTAAQVLRRCRPTADAIFGAAAKVQVAEPGTQLTAGETVELVDSKGRVGPCRIPHERPSSYVPGPLPKVSDDAGIKEACGSVLGHDLSGWQVTARAGSNGALAAVISSSNGWDASCRLTPVSWSKGTPQQVVDLYLTDRRLAKSQQQSQVDSANAPGPGPGSRASTVWLAAGAALGESGVQSSAATVQVFFSSGDSTVVPVVNGRFAFVIPTPVTPTVVPERVVIRDAKGASLGEW